ncbi:putative Mitochondrial import inner membrane translocase subunit TIM14 [Hypsibius exemplaris]|uniref:Mitochondrial import inner membrane translocase subunit TIM14 n=1 Tax=Hypsibius exemplaris TaxID=2072580 RepID=A0A1W0WBP4_HYPEX|nr:putative Mitochondrial import inner membrane translocase subunit TIM14 [Hypsibius exemplaris]
MATNVVVAGLTMAAVGFSGRILARYGGPLVTRMQSAIRIPSLSAVSNARYYKGGFDAKMDKREASLILGISPASPRLKISQAYKKLMVINHPDRGGSPYLAAKVNEAKDILEGLAEATDGSIYGGVEKYAKEDDPKDDVVYDPATDEQTGAGVPPTTAELSHRSKTDERETVGYAPKSSHDEKMVNETGASVEPDEVKKRAVVPAPSPTREHLIENYPHVFPKLEQQAAADAKKKAEEVKV